MAIDSSKFHQYNWKIDEEGTINVKVLKIKKSCENKKKTREKKNPLAFSEEHNKHLTKKKGKNRKPFFSATTKKNID